MTASGWLCEGDGTAIGSHTLLAGHVRPLQSHRQTQDRVLGGTKGCAVVSCEQQWSHGITTQSVMFFGFRCVLSKEWVIGEEKKMGAQ